MLERRISNATETKKRGLCGCGWVAVRRKRTHPHPHPPSLPNLIHFDLCERIYDRSALFALPSVVSLSLQHFSTLGTYFELPMLNQLFQHTPHLRSLRAHVRFTSTDNGITFSSSLPLTKLIITVIEWPFSTRFFSLLRNMPYLRDLDDDLNIASIDGDQWQPFISAYLPKLHTLELSQESWLETEDELEPFMDTFRTPFWTSERRWFVRCYVQDHHFHVQTLSK